MNSNRMGWVSAAMVAAVLATVGWGLHSQRLQGLESLRREVASLPDRNVWSNAEPDSVDTDLLERYYQWQEGVWNDLLDRQSSPPRALSASRNLLQRLLEQPPNIETAQLERRLPIPPQDLVLLDDLMKDGRLRLNANAWAKADRASSHHPLRPRMPNWVLAKQVTLRLAIRALQSNSALVGPRLRRLDSYIQAHLPPRTMIDTPFCMSLLDIRNRTVVALASQSRLPLEHPLRIHSSRYFDWSAEAIQERVETIAASFDHPDTHVPGTEAPRYAGSSSSPLSALMDWTHTPGDLAQAIRYLRVVAEDFRQARMPKMEVSEVISGMRGLTVPSHMLNPNPLLMATMTRSLERKLDLLTAQTLRVTAQRGRTPGDEVEWMSWVGDAAKEVLPRVAFDYKRLSDTAFTIEVDPSTLPPWHTLDEGRSSATVRWTGQ